MVKSFGFDDVQMIDSQEVQSTALTIYPDNLALVRETRMVDVPAGVVDIRFFGVTDMIIPQSAVLEEFEGLRLEGNFDADLITPAKLLSESVGDTLTIRRLNPVTGEADFVSAELISAAIDTAGRRGTTAVFSTLDGIEGYQCSGLPESIILSKLPDGLQTVPVLSTRVVAEESGPKEVTLTYLTRGLSWEADYRMDVAQDKPEGSLLGWLTLKNETSKSFEDTELGVVAGALNQVTDRNSSNNRPNWDRVATCVLHKFGGDVTESVVVQHASAPVAEVAYFAGGGGDEDTIIVTASKLAGVREATQEDLGDYKLYRAPQAVSVKAHQSKQIAFLFKEDIEFETSYSWTLSDLEDRQDFDLEDFVEDEVPMPSRLTYEIDNAKDGTLGVSLPKGTLRAMSRRRDGVDVFLGEGGVPNRPVGEALDVKIGDSFLVTARLYEMKEDDDGVVAAKIDLKNATDREVKTEFEFDLLTSVSVRKGRKRLSSEDMTYSFTLPAESSVSLSFRGKIPED